MLEQFARIHRIFERLSLWAVWVGGAALMLSAIMVTVDVLARKYLNITMSGSDEITGYVFAGATTWAYAYCLLHRSNIRIDAVYNLLPRVCELRAFLGRPASHVHEAHPDTSFTLMNGGTPLAPKTSPEGRLHRLELLRAWTPAVTPFSDGLTIDAIDAGAAAWTAQRVARGTHQVLGDPRRVDPDGYRLSMAA